jgi:hypothetical protein
MQARHFAVCSQVVPSPQHTLNEGTSRRALRVLQTRALPSLASAVKRVWTPGDVVNKLSLYLLTDGRRRCAYAGLGRPWGRRGGRLREEVNPPFGSLIGSST